MAFHHTRPFWPVHVVVVPKRHVPSLIYLGDADETLLHQVLAVVRRVAAQVTRDHGACRVVTNLGRYQDPKHLHPYADGATLGPFPWPNPRLDRSRPPRLPNLARPGYGEHPQTGSRHRVPGGCLERGQETAMKKKGAKAKKSGKSRDLFGEGQQEQRREGRTQQHQDAAVTM
jgi:histidine triad (HIT) family protein